MTVQFHRLPVEAVEQLTADAVCIVLAIPEPLREDYRYTAGQHLTIRYRTDGGGEQLRRSYSICAPPPPDGPPSRLAIAVKRHGPGGFADYAVRKLGPGEQLDVLTPVGGFHAQPGELQSGRVRVIAIAAGSGITPVLAILQEALRTNPDSSAALLYGNRTGADVMFLDELADLKDRYGPRFEVLHVLSREDHGSPLLTGRIDREKLPLLLDAIDAEPGDAYYLCGPIGMVDDCRAVLSERGAAHVRFELFDSGTAHKHTALTVAADRGEGPAVTGITVTLGGRTTRCELRVGDESLLAAIMRERPDVPYACTDGVCGTCRAKLRSGSVETARDYALEPEEKSGGFVLTCQSLPTSAQVELDFDA
ncbi:2Fe-2S iron-sulfur cluster binding domain-containing protein [Actinocrinis puniceicyclus]|uniref:2Fe-2S iron-sulfur cluster binding domain-containing protein n=1 Tax=Actinocrinis puniceicyclus TaxID=977794 RepID=A0A8J8BBB9_9ACTN|nr:2Fe-2S iron-sulfur cluster-binding protein [Actinocrinis puniceicyclus]MBS2963877.1 2Fe-2S iron-sulfur cluster binding domain-containing protein [Actinocrinis puniceicyclus]